MNGERLSRPQSKKGRMQRIVLELLCEKERNGEIPTNGRFVLYELEMAGQARKSRKGESRRDHGDDLPREQAVIDALTWLRNEDVIPWAWIEDETRRLDGYDHHDTVAGLLTSVCEHATINPWDGLPPLILCESRSLSGILRPLCDEYRCRLTATNGQARGFLVTEIAPILADNDRAVLYLGDLDHRGGQIEAHTQRVLEHETGRVFDWTRIAITEEQVAERGLTPTVKVDSAYRPPLEHDAWEAEALTQRVVVALVREALDLRLPQPLPDVQERERLEREALGDLLRESES